MVQCMKKWFGFEEQKTNFKTEILAGIQTFMTMVYIIMVHPSIMAACGMPQEAVFLSTCLVIVLTTLAMGIYGRFPFALAPGMGSNAIMSFTVVNAGVASWQTAMGMFFISGLLSIVVSVPCFRRQRADGAGKEWFSLREKVTKHIPIGMKLGLGAAIGMFLLRLGLTSTGITVIGQGELAAGDLTSTTVFISLVGLVITCFLFFGFNKRYGGEWKLPGAVLVGIVLTAVLLAVTGAIKWPEGQWFAVPDFSKIKEVAFQLDIVGALQIKYIPYIFVFFLGDFFSTVGTSLACSAKAGFMDKETGDIQNLDRMFSVDGTASAFGSLLGLPAVTTYVESAAGVEAGGRTGFTAVVTALCFAIATFMSDIFLWVPGEATGVALIVVGISMMLVLKDLPWDDMIEVTPILIMVSVTAYSGDFAAALCVGLIVHFIFSFFRWSMYASGWLKADATAKADGSLQNMSATEYIASLRPKAMTVVLAIMAVLQFVVKI